MSKPAAIFILFLLDSCNKPIDTDYIKKHAWKYGSGKGSVGDWISFEYGLYKLNFDTLFKQDTARAIIVSLKKNYFGGDTEMKIKNMQSGKHCTYHQK